MKAVSPIDLLSRLPALQPPHGWRVRGSGIIIQGDPNTELDTLVANLTPSGTASYNKPSQQSQQSIWSIRPRIVAASRHK